MKLYELPRNTKFKITEKGWGSGEVFTLERIDGMYSICTQEGVVDDEGRPAIFHIAAFAEVAPYEGDVVNEETTKNSS